MNNLKFKLGTSVFFDELQLSHLDPYASRALDKIEDDKKAFGGKVWPGPIAPTNPPSTTSTASGPNTASTAPTTTALEKLLQVRPVRELLDELANLQGKGETLEDLVGDAGQTGLLYDVQAELEKHTGSFNRQTLLKREAILYYLFAYATRVEGLTEAASIARWIADEDDGGIREIYLAVVDLAVRDLVDREKIEIGAEAPFYRYAENQIKKSQFAFTDKVFDTRIRALVTDYAFDNDNYDLIEAWRAKNLAATPLTAEDRRYLNEVIKKSAVPITAANSDHFLSIAFYQRSNRTLSVNGLSTTGSPLDFSVNYYEEDQEALAINSENIHAAAQLFYVMTLADELGLFDAADLLITQYLTSGQVDIRDSQTLFYLQQYAFSEEFTDPTSGEVIKRTEPEERHMFYRQVFSLGDGDVMEGAVYNTEFEQVWYNLMNEVAHYIQQLGESENPVAFVSRQYVAQTIEDLRYNLSNHCTGLAKAISPIINKELDFIIKRFFQNEEIIQQLALHNSRSFWKVPERILQDRAGRAINLTGAVNKARLGHVLISTSADFTAAMVEDDAEFSQFISAVQAFIIANSKLDGEESQRSDLPSDRYAAKGVAANGNGIPEDDWNF